MKMRPLLHLILMVSIVCWAKFGSFFRVEQDYLASLFSNVRDKIVVETDKVSDEVIFVEFSEADKDEFSQWPPAPLDYIVVLKRLLAAEPAMVIFPDTLHWDDQVEFLEAFKEGLLPFSRALLGFSLEEKGESLSEEGLIFALSDIPKTLGLFRDTTYLPKVKQVKEAPQTRLRSTLDLGFSEIVDSSGGDGPWIAANFKDEFVVPSLVHQAVTLYRRVPYVQQGINLGRNATWNLNHTYLLPLSPEGEILLSGLVQVPKLSALEMMIPDLGDDDAQVQNQSIGKNKIIVLGQSSLKEENGSGLAYDHARWIASALSIAPIQSAPFFLSFIVGLVSFILALRQVKLRRVGALFYGALLLGLWYAIAVMVFQTSQFWWSPMGWILLAASTIYCVLWKRGQEPEAPEEAQSSMPVSSVTEEKKTEQVKLSQEFEKSKEESEPSTEIKPSK